ncbi:MAG TPA: hypothetical protein PK634_05250, partial [Kiritimatiellia bacterium]|nr:hypothetical protein [Kiritimatiellia bacterium]
MSVSTGLSSCTSSAPIFCATSRTSPIIVWLPRPNCAALTMKGEFGAEPNPTVNRRGSESRSRISVNSAASLP